MGTDTEHGKHKEEFRQRTKAYASAVIRLYCSLPLARTEVQVLGRQLIRSGTSVAAIYREASRARSDAEFVAKVDNAHRRLTSLSSGLSYCVTTVAVDLRSWTGWSGSLTS
jgi:four helix bundle protein